MKRILLIFIALFSLNGVAFSQDFPRKDDFENITNLFQIRNLQNGIALNILRDGSVDSQNWRLKEFTLSPKLAQKDKLGKIWNFGYVQFVHPKRDDSCLAIFEDGFLGLKSCRGDLSDEKLETVFSIIPTSAGAVQIRSLVLDSDECLSAFDNPNVPIENRFGILPCGLDSFFFIDTAQLFFFAPALTTAVPALPFEP